MTKDARASVLVGRAVDEHTGAASIQPVPLECYVQHHPQILIVCADESASRVLTSILEEGNLDVESVTTMDEGCVLAASGRFEVVLSQPHLPDGSWKRLIELASRDGTKFEIILLARKFNTRRWLQALKEGAFDVIDVVYGLDAVQEPVRHALWVGYLGGVGQHLTEFRREGENNESTEWGPRLRERSVLF